MPNLDKIKDKTLDKMVTQIKDWVSEGKDVDLKDFLKKNTPVQGLDKQRLKAGFGDFMDEDDKSSSAADDLDDLLQEEETPICMMFGTPQGGAEECIPENARGKRVDQRRAREYLEGWRLGAKAGEPTCDMLCWTNKRIIWNKVGQGGKSTVHSVPALPIDGEFPELP
jgi:hypothetical protein